MATPTKPLIIGTPLTPSAILCLPANGKDIDETRERAKLAAEKVRPVKPQAGIYWSINR